MIVLGAVAGLAADLLQPFLVGTIVGVLALILTFGGMTELVRYFISIRDRIIAGFKSGAGLRVIKDEWMEVVQSCRKLVAILKSTEPKPTPTPSREATAPPSDKKAA